MKRKSAGDITFSIFNYTSFTIIALICFYPFYYIFIISFSDPTEVIRGHVLLLPSGVTFSNYMNVFQLRNILNSFMVSLARTVAGTVITVGCTSLLAYLVTKKKFPLRKPLYRMCIMAMYFHAGLIPWYILMITLGLKNNFLLYVLPGAINSFQLILIKTYIEQLPESLDESAQIDGASFVTVFVKIVFPLSMPIIATVAVFSAVGQWNTWYDNLFLVTNPRLKTAQLILYEVIRDAELLASQQIRDIADGSAGARPIGRITPTTIRMTVTMIVTLPIMLVYPFMQKYFMKGIMLGAVKG